jgi:hypothetical protein
VNTTDEQQVALERSRRLFRHFARTQCEGRSALYTRLGHGVADDEELLRLLLDAPPSQRRPSLLLASVNHLLGEYRDDPLAAYYPIHGGDREADDQALSPFRAFCRAHRAELRDLLATRNTQTNEVRRCFALRLGLARIAELWPGPVALLEIGASAGLNLALDAYTYRVAGREIGPAGGSSVTLSTVLRGGGGVDGLLGELPEIGYRMGADLDPVDLAADAGAARWLEAFIWPEQVEELAVLRAAVELSKRHRYPMVRADACTDTAALVAEVPGDLPVVVFTASLLSYLDATARTRFVGRLAQAARGRAVAWLFTEAPGLVSRTDVTAPALAGPLRGNGEVYAVGVSLRTRTGRYDEVLALAHPYGEWIAPARERGDDFAWSATELNLPPRQRASGP